MVKVPDVLPVDPDTIPGNDVLRSVLAQLPADEVADMLPLDGPEDIKTYIATMLDMLEVEKAREKLEELRRAVSLSADDLAFIRLFDLLIGLAEADKTWLDMRSDQLAVVETIATGTTRTALPAQAVYSAVTGQRFTPSVAALSDPLAPAMKQQQDKTVTAGPDHGAISMYPNPASGEVKITLLGDITLQRIIIYNALGAVVFESGTLPKGTSLSLPLENIPSGAYSVHFVEQTGQRTTQMLVIQK